LNCFDYLFELCARRIYCVDWAGKRFFLGLCGVFKSVILHFRDKNRRLLSGDFCLNLRRMATV
ncbi:MAG: hypothetical protein RLZZ396_1468, partial [Planctomycetota bacterium]|jgi:hypothetical protein